MPGKPAKILSEDDLQDLLVYASATRNPIRNRVIVLLSAKAGLRAGEIANLTWDMVLGPTGAVGAAIELRDHAASCSNRAAVQRFCAAGFGHSAKCAKQKNPNNAFQ